MKILSYELKQAIKQYGFTPVELLKDAVYEAGNTYWCGYWGKWYQVLGVKYVNHGKYKELIFVTVQWQDGRIGTHCTALDPRHDYKLCWTT